MSLIRLITTIIRLSFAKGLEDLRRDPARPTNKKATRAAKEKKKERKGERRGQGKGGKKKPSVRAYSADIAIFR